MINRVDCIMVKCIYIYIFYKFTHEINGKIKYFLVIELKNSAHKNFKWGKYTSLSLLNDVFVKSYNVPVVPSFCKLYSVAFLSVLKFYVR